MHIDPLFSADNHPVIITPSIDIRTQALREYLTNERAKVDELLMKHGGILFRGFDLQGSGDFQACVESVGGVPFHYVGGNSPRSRVAADVYTSTEYPASEVISLHNEMSYLPKWPRRLFFFCAAPAQHGGQTSLANGGDVLRAAPSSIVEKIRNKKLNYIRNFPSNKRLGKSWQSTYQTEDPGEVEAIAHAQGSTCHWFPDGALRVTTRCRGLEKHPQTGQEVWFNQAEQWHPSALTSAMRTMLEGMLGKGKLPHDCEYGDDEPIDEEAMEEVRHSLVKSKLLFDWQRSDLLMIDNVLLMHGREPYRGDRKIFAYLSLT